MLKAASLVLLALFCGSAEARMKAGPVVMSAHVREWTGSLAGGGSDPSFSNVVLLMHFDGTDAAQTFADSSSVPHTVTGTVNHKLTTAQQKYGSASLDCVITGSDAATTPDSNDWNFAAGQFTLEAWVRPTVALSGLRTVVAQWAGAGTLSWWFGYNGNALNFYYSTTGSDNPSITGAYTPTLNSWAHIAMDRDASNIVRLYADGVVIASGTAAATFFNTGIALYVGNDGTGTRAITGQIDELRITKGVARYGGAFTPPTSPFPNQ